MAKSFKEYRESWEDDEWGDSEDRQSRSKEKRMKSRRDKRKLKHEEKYSNLDKNEK